MVYKNITEHIKRMPADAKLEGRFKCVVCGKNATEFVIAKTYCKEHGKIAKAKYHHKFHVKYYPEHSEKINKVALEHHKKTYIPHPIKILKPYIPHPRKLLSAEEKRLKQNKFSREYWRRNYIPHPAKTHHEETYISYSKKRLSVEELKMNVKRSHDKYFKKTYVPHPRIKLSDEELRKRKNKRERNRYQKLKGGKIKK